MKTAARENAEKIINGDKSSRSTRTDDMQKQSDGKGHSIGGKNEQLYDLAEVGPNGEYIEGSGRQLKYVGGDSEQCAKKLLDKKYDKYRDADVPIEVPADYYDGVQARLSQKVDDLSKQIERAEKNGNTELAKKYREQLERVKKTKENLRKGKLTNKEAMEARTNPVLSTAKDIAKVSHRAGLEGAKTGAMIGGGISIVRNLVAVVKGEREPEEAVAEVAKDTASSAAHGYATGFMGAAIKGLMQKSESGTLQVLSETNLPGILVTVAVTSAKVMKRYFDGEIDGVECFEELGQEGVGMVSSSLFATLGQIAIPIPVVGGLIGGMLGYALASASYGVLLNSVKEAKFAHEERVMIEAECQRQIEQIREYRMEVEKLIGEYLVSKIEPFQSAFDSIKSSLEIGDVDGFISGANSISELFGREAQFHNMNEFDAIMASNEAFKL